MHREGHLLNTEGDILFDKSVSLLECECTMLTHTDALSVLLLCVLLAYLPQYLCSLLKGSTEGISPYYVLSQALFSNAQLSYALLMSAYIYPNDREPVLRTIASGSLRGRDAWGGMLGLLQVAMQWACSVIL